MFGHFSGDSSPIQDQLKGAQHVHTESRCEAQVVCLCVCGTCGRLGMTDPQLKIIFQGDK